MIEKLAKVPLKPGVYLFRDDKGKVLYVGKAKVLRNRVRSYFQKASGLDERKSAMMRSVAGYEFTVTANELEALILEANLIKQHRPRYNILLRDDKNYPYLKLTLSERWPRLEVVRRIQKDGSRYFGPYVPAGAMWETLSFIRSHYHIPACRYSLEKRMRPCIQHQMRRCIGPCSGEVDHTEYLKMIREVELLLEGRSRKLLAALEENMVRLSEDMQYEEAAAVRDRIRAIRTVSESQKVVSPELGDADVLGFFRLGDKVVFKVFFIRNGVMIGTRDFEQKNTSGETDGYLFRNVIEQFYAKEILPAPELYCSRLPEDASVLAAWLTERRGAKVRIMAPGRGLKRKLVAMAEENAEEILRSRGPELSQEITKEIGLLLGLSKAPGSIGAFDISNITGSSAVGAFVYWEEGAFNKSRYRHVRMDAVKGPDDYAMMKEMIRRTIESLKGRGQGKDEQTGQGEGVMPDLVIIDGGREHLKAALEVFRGMDMPAAGVVGLAKDPDRVFLKNREAPIPIDDSRPASLLLRRIRDEAHRFAVRYHRKQRAKKAFESFLDRIYGLGRQRRFALLERFGSIEAVRQATAEEIASVKGFNRKLAENVVAGLAKDR